MIEDPERVETAITDIMQKYRDEIREIDTAMAKINIELSEINTKRDDILEIITGAAFERFKNELKDLNSRELVLKEKNEQLQLRKDMVQLDIKKAVTARELFTNMTPLGEFDDIMIPKLVEKIVMIAKDRVKVVFRGGVEAEGSIEKK